jgi:predicted amidohydrolase YtcJ
MDRSEHLVFERVSKKRQIKAGRLADLAVLSDDYFSVPEDEIVHFGSRCHRIGDKPLQSR